MEPDNVSFWEGNEAGFKHTGHSVALASALNPHCSQAEGLVGVQVDLFLASTWFRGRRSCTGFGKEIGFERMERRTRQETMAESLINADGAMGSLRLRIRKSITMTLTGKATLLPHSYLSGCPVVLPPETTQHFWVGQQGRSRGVPLVVFSLNACRRKSHGDRPLQG